MLKNETPMTDKKDPKICSMCGEENNCGMGPEGSAGVQKGSDSCWCFSLVFSDSLKATLKKDFAEQACICKNCFEKKNVEKNG